MDDTKDFSELDLSKVDFESGRWIYNSGGRPLREDEWYISHFDNKLNETRYRLPACINRMLEEQFIRGVEATIAKIRAAIGME